MKVSEDIEIIKQVLNGNTSAYKSIIDKHKNSCFNLAYRILGNRQDAEECTADAFINAFNALKNYNNNFKFRSWLMKITFNRAISMRRKKKIPIQQIENEDEYSYIQDSVETYSQIFSADKKMIIDNALSCLDNESRAIVNLFYYEEFSLEEISDLVNSNINTVKSKLFRARQKMKSAINRFYQNEEKNMVL